MTIYIILFTIFLTGMLLGGDYLIKYSTESSHTIRYLIMAAILWVASIPGWYYIVRNHKIAIVGILFAMFSLIGTTLIGVIGFNEKLTNYEWLGIGLAIVSTLLLTNKL